MLTAIDTFSPYVATNEEQWVEILGYFPLGSWKLTEPWIYSYHARADKEWGVVGSLFLNTRQGIPGSLSGHSERDLL
jgi:hypothetical protein